MKLNPQMKNALLVSGGVIVGAIGALMINALIRRPVGRHPDFAPALEQLLNMGPVPILAQKWQCGDQIQRTAGGVLASVLSIALAGSSDSLRFRCADGPGGVKNCQLGASDCGGLKNSECGERWLFFDVVNGAVVPGSLSCIDVP